jgi:hypothetical protein
VCRQHFALHIHDDTAKKKKEEEEEEEEERGRSRSVRDRAATVGISS